MQLCNCTVNMISHILVKGKGLEFREPCSPARHCSPNLLGHVCVTMFNSLMAANAQRRLDKKEEIVVTEL